MMLIVLMIILIISSVSVYADDNADTGEGEIGDALEDKGFYRTSE